MQSSFYWMQKCVGVWCVLEIWACSNAQQCGDFISKLIHWTGFWPSEAMRTQPSCASFIWQRLTSCAMLKRTINFLYPPLLWLFSHIPVSIELILHINALRPPSCRSRDLVRERCVQYFLISCECVLKVASSCHKERKPLVMADDCLSLSLALPDGSSC